MLFLTSFQTHHVTCCVSVGVKTEAGVKKKNKKTKVFGRLTQHSAGPSAGDRDGRGVAFARYDLWEFVR